MKTMPSTASPAGNQTIYANHYCACNFDGDVDIPTGSIGNAAMN